MRRGVEARIMERQVESNANFPPFVQDLIERGKREGIREGAREGRLTGKLEGFREGKLHGKREVLLRLTARAGLTIAEADRTRILTCTDPATLDRWIDNALGAKTILDVLS
jgi:predicted transposase YdaD